MKKAILIKDAYENNLKHINVSIPLNAFTCVIGCSGSGKSSLVFETIYAESQRRFFDGLTGNLYGQKLMNKPKVGSIENLYPAVNISQNYYNVNPRSTVGTVTEISYYLRSLFSILNNGISENNFSSNNPEVYCPHCYGLGIEKRISEALLIPDKQKTLREGAILYFKGSSESKEQKYLQAMCEHYNIDIDKTIAELSVHELEKLLYADEGVIYKISYREGKKRKKHNIFLHGAIVDIQEKVRHNEASTIYSKYMEEVPCHVCGGARLIPEILNYRVNGLNYNEVENLELTQLNKWLNEFDYSNITADEKEIVAQILTAMSIRINSLLKLNVGYLSLKRMIPTLSSGERQRVRIAVQLTCSLKGLIYILDEPCKGLHFRDVFNVIQATHDLIKNDSTVIAIEHNPQYISTADNIIELGPVGGPAGGYIISQGKIRTSQCQEKYLLKPIRKFNKYFEIKHINFRNIKDQNVRIPLESITCITGVSGSGKTSLTTVILKCFEKQSNFCCDIFTGGDTIKKVIEVNQSPIGKTPRSTVVSYLNIYDDIRTLFSRTETAKKMKLSTSSFSMNVSGGRCECCQGTGVQKIELNYLQDFYVTCTKCKGKRFKTEILEVMYKGKNIQEVLDTPISDIAPLFEDNKKIHTILNSMVNLGLGYLKLGQMSMNLSGGEAQRIKLARALGMSSNGHNLYIFDEPTSGLHDIDVKNFVKNVLALQKNHETVIIIEHNIKFVLEVADYVLDFGVLSGNSGGKIVVQGTTLDVLNNPISSIHNYTTMLKGQEMK